MRRWKEYFEETLSIDSRLRYEARNENIQIITKEEDIENMKIKEVR